MSFVVTKLFIFSLASIHRSALIELADGRCACFESRCGGIKPGAASDSRNDDFLLVLFV